MNIDFKCLYRILYRVRDFMSTNKQYGFDNGILDYAIIAYTQSPQSRSPKIQKYIMNRIDSTSVGSKQGAIMYYREFDTEDASGGIND